MSVKIDLSEYRLYDKNIDHYIGAMTQSVHRLHWRDKAELMKAFNEIPKDKRGDTFYCAELRGQKYFIEYNGEMGYTILLPEEH